MDYVLRIFIEDTCVEVKASIQEERILQHFAEVWLLV